MSSRQNEFNSVLLNIVPLGYYYYSRLRFYCKRFPCHLLVLAWEASQFLIPTLWFYYVLHGFDLGGFMIIFVSTFLLYVIYEIGYVFNDTFTDKRDSRPANRPAARALNLLIFSISRTVYLLILGYYVYMNVPFDNILRACFLLVYGLLLHNLTFEKAYRYATFTVLRFAKYLFVPILVFGVSIETFYIMTILIPTIVHDTLLSYGYKYLTGENVKFPRMIKYGVFVPFIAVLLGIHNLPAYAHLIVLSFIRRRNENE